MDFRELVIDPDITHARSLPGWFYSSEEVYARSLERIFARSWQVVAETDAVRVPGQVWPTEFLPGALPEPLLLTRDASDELHCLSNVCTHRGNLICAGPGVEHTLRCRYHGRRFGLDGRMTHMPEFEGVRDFPAATDDLPRVAHAVWGPLIFAGLAPFAPLEELLGPLAPWLAALPLEAARPAPDRAKDYLVRANWALYCENYLEGFHIPYVHPGLNDELDYGRYRTELYAYASVQLGVARQARTALPPRADAGPDDPPIAGCYYWVFPNTMINVYPWGLSINLVQPRGVALTRVLFRSYVWDESRLEEGAGRELDRVEREDEAIVEAVQRGVSSRLYTRGRYSPVRETGVHHFHRLLTAFLA